MPLSTSLYQRTSPIRGVDLSGKRGGVGNNLSLNLGKPRLGMAASRRDSTGRDPVSERICKWGW